MTVCMHYLKDVFQKCLLTVPFSEEEFISNLGNLILLGIRPLAQTQHCEEAKGFLLNFMYLTLLLWF